MIIIPSLKIEKKKKKIKNKIIIQKYKKKKQRKRGLAGKSNFQKLPSLEQH